MKNTSLKFLLFCALPTDGQSNAILLASDFKKLSWLEGAWNRTKGFLFGDGKMVEY